MSDEYEQTEKRIWGTGKPPARNHDPEPSMPDAPALREGPQAFINHQRDMVNERRGHLDRVHTLAPEHAKHVQPLPDLRRPEGVTGHVPPAPTGRIEPGAAPLAHQPFPESEAQKRGHRTPTPGDVPAPDIPRTEDGVPDFELPAPPQVPTDEDGVPEFRLREAPKAPGDADDGEEN